MITADNIVEAMRKWGKDVTEEEVQELIRKHDLHKNGIISFEEFRFMIMQGSDPLPFAP